MTIKETGINAFKTCDLSILKNFEFNDCWNFLSTGSDAGGHVMLQYREEAELIWNYAKKTTIIEDENTILEIGRYRAGSTLLLAAATHNLNVKIISVDIIDGCRHCYTIAYDWLNNYEEKERIDIRVENSWSMENESLSMLFVDGDHSYDGIKKDIIHHWNYLKGYCLVDDYNEGHGVSVKSFIDEWIDKGYAEIVDQENMLVVLKKLKDYENE